MSDVTAQLGGDATASYQLTVDREKFLRTRHQTEVSLPVQVSTEPYIPTERIGEVLGRLQDGDFVNVISTRNGGYWASHVGLIVTAPDGRRMFLNSAAPQVREETFDDFVKRVRERDARNGPDGQKLAGFKFLRLNDEIVVPPALPQPRPGQRGLSPTGTVP